MFLYFKTAKELSELMIRIKLKKMFNILKIIHHVYNDILLIAEDSLSNGFCHYPCISYKLETLVVFLTKNPLLLSFFFP